MPMSQQCNSDVKINSQNAARERTEKGARIEINIVRRVNSDYDSRLLNRLVITSNSITSPLLSRTQHQDVY